MGSFKRRGPYPENPEFTLTEAPKVTDEVARAHETYSRFHDLYDALTWRLCRDPLPVEAKEIAKDIFMLKTEPISLEGFCVITIVYTIDQERYIVNIEDMWVAPTRLS